MSTKTNNKNKRNYKRNNYKGNNGRNRTKKKVTQYNKNGFLIEGEREPRRQVFPGDKE